MQSEIRTHPHLAIRLRIAAFMNRTIECDLLKADGEYEGRVVYEDLPYECREGKSDDGHCPCIRTPSERRRSTWRGRVLASEEEHHRVIHIDIVASTAYDQRADCGPS
jgi:hypothetical protein